MLTTRFRRVSYLILVVKGLVTAVAPRVSLELNVRVWGFPFKNPGALEPKAWYVRTTRAVGVGMIAAGLAGLVLESQAGTDEEESEGADESDDPIEVTVG